MSVHRGMALRRRDPGKRILPFLYLDNYISMGSERQKKKFLEYPVEFLDPLDAVIHVEGWSAKSLHADLNQSYIVNYIL